MRNKTSYLNEQITTSLNRFNEEVKERIEADNGRPVGANVTVVSFDNKDIEITVITK